MSYFCHKYLYNSYVLYLNIKGFHLNNLNKYYEYNRFYINIFKRETHF